MATLLRSRGLPAIQRDFSREIPLSGVHWTTKWRAKVKGDVVVTVNGKPTKKPVVENMEFETESDGEVDIAVSVKATWDEWRKSWRLGDYGWKSQGGLGSLPFEFSGRWMGRVKDGAVDVAFVFTNSDKTLSIDLPGLDAETLYEARPYAQGDTAVLTIVVYRNGKPLEMTSRIKLKAPPKTPPPVPSWLKRNLVIDGFPRSRATISAENFRKIEDFWYELTPDTRKALQNNELLNGRKVQVIGHTSNTDKAPRNFDLGYARARAVADVLRKLSGNTEATNFAPLSTGERGNATDETAKEVEDPAERKVTIELWEQPDLLWQLKKAWDILGGSKP